MLILLFLTIFSLSPLFTEEISVSPVQRSGEVWTGYQPKSVTFAPDGSCLIVPLLGDSGVDLFSVPWLHRIGRLAPPGEYAAKKGFVEPAVLSRRGEIWISQMTTGMVHIFDLESFEYLRSFSTRGRWSKVILADSDEDRVFISNWLSYTVESIDPEDGSPIRTYRTGGIPRGLGLSPNEKYLYVANFEDGIIEKFNTELGTRVHSIGKGSAMRHILIDPETMTLYCSDMGRGSVVVVRIDQENDTGDKLLREIFLGPKINTIALSRDGSCLFASSRGPNNPESYLLKGPEFGKIFFVDTESYEVTHWLWGKNQPTGLAISPAGDYLAFTDFLDHNLQLYRIK